MFYVKQLEIGCLRLGGIGDALELAMFAVAIRRKYPDCNITLFVRTQEAADILKGRKDIKHIRIVHTDVWVIELLRICNSQEFDIIYDNRYVTRVFYKDEERFADDKKKTDEAFKEYAPYYNTMPMRCNELGRKWPGSNRDLALKTACLKGDDNDSKISLSGYDSKFIPLLDGKQYVTIHNASHKARGSKSWSMQHWVEFTWLLRNKGYVVIQLGAFGDKAVKGAINMTEKLSIKESAAMIKGAQFHVDTESGLVHIAKSVGTRSIVLFGPTPLNFFAYKENVNIEPPGNCKGCWWTSGLWIYECPRSHAVPIKCVDLITPNMVMGKVFTQIEHGSLRDLADDDQPQYFLKRKLSFE